MAAMIRVGTCASAALTLLFAGCGAAPEPVPDPQLEQNFIDEQAEKEKQLARQDEFGAVLLRLDKALDKYVAAWLTADYETAEQLQGKLDTYIRQEVDKHFAELVRAADQRELPANRTIAAAALGFSGRREALDPLLNAAHDKNPEVAIAALLGLAVLRDPNTPPAALGEIMMGAADLQVRRNASLALLKLQERLFKPEVTLPIWQQVLAEPLDKVDPAILMHAIRGVGLLRDPACARDIERYVSHPVAKLRETTAIALGRMKNPASHTSLLALLGPTESNPNVRLAARKALQALAGNVDRGYDVEEWRKAFERGQ
jgi:HEAT repeat protein